MHTLPTSHLAPALRAQAEGSYTAEAAVELLIGHGVWLARRDFLNELVEYAGDSTTITHAWVAWEHVPTFANRAPCSGSEGRILRLAAELHGTDTGVPLAELLSQLDDTNSALVRDAIDHILSHGGRR